MRGDLRNIKTKAFTRHSSFNGR